MTPIPHPLPSSNSISSGNNGSGGTGYAGGKNSRENVGQGQGGPSEEATKDGTKTGIADISAWEEPIRVTVESVTEELWLASNESGFERGIEGRLLSYLLEQGFTAKVGDELTLVGFFEGDKFEVGQIANETTGQSMVVREESGRPLWAGGRRGGN